MNKYFQFIFLFWSNFSLSQTVSIQYDANNSRRSICISCNLQLFWTSSVQIGRCKTQRIKFILSWIHFSLIAESFSITTIKINPSYPGGDDQVLIYGVKLPIEDLKNGIKLNDIKKNKSNLFYHYGRLNLICHGIPTGTAILWISTMPSAGIPIIGQHFSITMSSVNRLNALSLWNLHPYVYFIKPVHYPEASPWNNQQMQDWQLLFIPFSDGSWSRDR